jgi:hypothetical protein
VLELVVDVLRCRKVKEKCEGGEPCRRCVHLRRQCNFSDAVPTTSYQRSDVELEEMSTRVRYLEGLLKHTSPNVALDTESLRRKYEEITPRITSNAQPENAEDDDLNIEDESIEIRPVDHNTTHYSGEFSYWNFSMRIKKHVQDFIANPHDRKGSQELPEYWRPTTEFGKGTSSIRTALQALPPYDITLFLVKVFFKYAQRNYFYVDRSWLTQQIHRAYNDTWSGSIRDPGTVAAIFAVLAVGTQYAHLDAGAPNRGAVPSEDEVGAMFYRTATKLLPEMIQTSSLECVQAISLLGLTTISLDASGLSWIYYNLAIRLAIQNGMHRRYQGTELNAITIETRNRVWWTALSVANKISLFHGRPSSITRSDVDADFPKDISEMPDDDGPLSIDRMVVSIRLIDYLESFMAEIQKIRKSDKKELSHTVLRLTEMKGELTAWFESIPESAFSVSRGDGQAYRSVVHLKLLYCLLRMFIGRPFLFTGSRLDQPSPDSPPDARKYSAESKHRENSTTSTIDGKRRPSRRLALVQTTVDAAVEALELCRTLFETSEGLARASYIEYSSCRASMLVLIAYSIQERTNQFQEVMKAGLEMVREMSPASESARAESALIEALERAVHRLQMFSPDWQRRRDSLGGPPATTPQRTQLSNYDRFKSWQQSWRQGTGGASGAMGPPTPPQVDISNSSLDQQQYPSPFNGSDRAVTGHEAFPVPTSAPINSDAPDTSAPQYSQTHAQAEFHSAAAAEAVFFQTLNTMPDVTPSTAAVNGWLTQARPERQVLDHFLSMPDGAFENLAMGYPDGSLASNDGVAGYTDNTMGASHWYDLGHLPGFGFDHV